LGFVINDVSTIDGVRPFCLLRVLFCAGGNQAFALRLLARELTCPTDCFAFFSRRFLRWLLIEPSSLHPVEDAFRCIFFQHSESLLDIAVTNEYLKEIIPSVCPNAQHDELADRVDEDRCAKLRGRGASTAIEYDCLLATLAKFWARPCLSL
jgi:hypothetical protein